MLGMSLLGLKAQAAQMCFQCATASIVVSEYPVLISTVSIHEEQKHKVTLPITFKCL